MYYILLFNNKYPHLENARRVHYFIIPPVSLLCFAVSQWHCWRIRRSKRHWNKFTAWKNTENGVSMRPFGAKEIDTKLEQMKSKTSWILLLLHVFHFRLRAKWANGPYGTMFDTKMFSLALRPFPMFEFYIIFILASSTAVHFWFPWIIVM